MSEPKRKGKADARDGDRQSHGYWIWKVKDLDEAIVWVKQCPNPMPGPSIVEIRPFYEMEDFA